MLPSLYARLLNFYRAGAAATIQPFYKARKIADNNSLDVYRAYFSEAILRAKRKLLLVAKPKRRPNAAFQQ
jgi:hypothetical protein